MPDDELEYTSIFKSVAQTAKYNAMIGSWNSGKKYYDDENAILKEGDVDDHGAERGLKQNMFDSYVYDLQNDLLQLRFVEVGKPDGIFGRRTGDAVAFFQRETSYWPPNDNYKDQVSLLITRKVDKVTKKAIKKWIEKKYQRQGIFYEFRLIPQSTPNCCWAATTSMLLSSPTNQVPSPPLNNYPKPSDVSNAIHLSLSDPRGLLDNPDTTYVQDLAKAYNLWLYRPEGNITLEIIRNKLIINGPLFVSTLVNTNPYQAHAYLIVGIISTRNRDNILYADPAPMNKGEIREISFTQFQEYFDNQAAMDINRYRYIIHKP
jgi:hypothetical protein